MVRTSRKAAGHPASSNVGELAELIQALRSVVEMRLGGRKISGAVAMIPHLTAMYMEDLEDAFEYVGLIYVSHYPIWYSGIFPESGAVYVGNGFGLCSNYTDQAFCEEEQYNPPHQPSHEGVLSVSLTAGILSSIWSLKSMGFAYPNSNEFESINFNHDLDKRNNNPKENYY